MADEQLIKPRELPAATTVFADDAIMTDNGSVVGKATPVQIVNAGAPVPTEAEAIAGTDNSKRMTPLTVKQVLDSVTAPSVLRAQAWAESDSPPNPGIPGSMSAKSWAAEAERLGSEQADRAESAAADAVNNAPFVVKDEQTFLDKTDLVSGSRYLPKDGGWDVSDEGPGDFEQAGKYVSVVPDMRGSITLEQLGAPADGINSDHEYYVKAENILAARGGGWIVLKPGKTYRIGKPLSEPIFPTPNTPKHRVSIWAYGAEIIAPDNSHGIILESFPGDDRFIIGGTWDGNWDGLGGAVAWNGNPGQQPAVSIGYGVRTVARDIVIRRAVADGFQFPYSVNPLVDNVQVLSSGEHAFYGAAIYQGVPILTNCGTKNCGMKASGNGACMVKFRRVVDFVVDGFIGEAPDALEPVLFTSNSVQAGTFLNVKAKDLYNIASTPVDSEFDNENVVYRNAAFQGIGTGSTGVYPPQGNVWSGVEISSFASAIVSGDCENIIVRNVPNLTFGNAEFPNHRYLIRNILLDNCGANTDTVFTYGKASVSGLDVHGAAVPSIFTVSGADQRWTDIILEQADGGVTVPFIQVRHPGSHTIRGVLQAQGSYFLRTHADGVGAVIDVAGVKTKALNAMFDEHGFTWNVSDWFVERSGSGTVFNLAHASSVVRYSGVGTTGISTFKTGVGTATNVMQA